MMPGAVRRLAAGLLCAACAASFAGLAGCTTDAPPESPGSLTGAPQNTTSTAADVPTDSPVTNATTADSAATTGRNDATSGRNDATSGPAVNLMQSISAEPVTGKPADNAFNKAVSGFAVNLFQRAIQEDKNSLVSPLSVLLALGMTANGADGVTRTQMEAALGGLPADTLNRYLYSYVKTLPDAETYRLHIANSVWMRDGYIDVLPSFLQTASDYYGAAAFRAPFDAGTVGDINKWVKTNTDGMIDSLLDEIPEDAVMYLINAMAFDAEWLSQYSDRSVSPGTFRAADGKAQSAQLMRSTEHMYLENDKITGFSKSYAGDKYRFVALLPREGVSVSQAAASLSGEGFRTLLNTGASLTVHATMPKFSYEYDIKLKDTLRGMGMTDAFSAAAADFTRIGSSPLGRLCINDVIHKTFIAVDQRGTRAGAVTATEMTAAGIPSDPKTVTLDRPFLYAIVDAANNLPLFMGAVMSVE